MTALVAAGCGRVQPGTAGAPQPTPTAAALGIGSDQTGTGIVLTQLLARSLQAKGRDAAAVTAGADWRVALGHGELAAMPAFADTLWTSLSKGAEPPPEDALLGELAGLLEPEVGVLACPDVDGRLVWLVTRAVAETGITSLSRIGTWSRDRVAAVPSLAVSRADGVPGLRTVYGAKFRVDEVDDPVERALRLTTGDAQIAAFRATDYTGASGLVELVDTEKLTVADPVVVLVNQALADAEPNQVLAMDALAQTLTTDSLIDLQAQVASGGSAVDVANRWLTGQGLG